MQFLTVNAVVSIFHSCVRVTMRVYLNKSARSCDPIRTGLLQYHTHSPNLASPILVIGWYWSSSGSARHSYQNGGMIL